MTSDPLITEGADPASFRVDRRIYTDPEIFDRELRQIFARGWVYLCHESQVAAHGDYYATYMCAQPVFVIRQRLGSLGAHLHA